MIEYCTPETKVRLISDELQYLINMKTSIYSLFALKRFTCHLAYLLWLPLQLKRKFPTTKEVLNRTSIPMALVRTTY